MKLVYILPLILLAGCKVVTKDDSSAAEKDQSITAMNDAQKAYSDANAKMHAGMNNIPADADEAFIIGMIPHHQGAIDMANIVLQHGDDDETKTLARNIIKAQEDEIAWMQNWLEKRGIETPPPGPAKHQGH